MQTIKLLAQPRTKDGSITFDNITVDKAGTFKYTITETKGTDKTITYSDKTITATVVVVEKDNALVVEQISYSDGQTGDKYVHQQKKAPKTESVTATLQIEKSSLKKVKQPYR